MARSKKTVSQKVVGVATSGLPSPARKVLGSRVVALLIVLAVPVLFATGIVSLKWENGRPSLSINRERAAEVKEEAAEKIQNFKQEHRTEPEPRWDIGAQLREQGGESEPAFQPVTQLREQFGEARQNFEERIEGHEKEAEPAFQPISQLRERFGEKR